MKDFDPLDGPLPSVAFAKSVPTSFPALRSHTVVQDATQLPQAVAVEGFNDERTGHMVVGGVAQDETDPQRAEDYD